MTRHAPSASPRCASNAALYAAAAGLAAFLLSPSPARAQAAPTPVVVANVTEAPALLTLPLTGTVEPRRLSRVAAQVAGYVSDLRVDDGDSVASGDVLAALDDALERAAVRAARATLQQGRVRLADAERRRDEAIPLVADGNIPRTQYDSLEAEVAQERAGVTRLEAELSRRDEFLARHQVRAPFNGLVARRLTETGQWVLAGTPVVELQELDVVRVRAEVPQTWFSKVDAGTPAELIFDAYPQRPLNTRVSIKVGVADAAARTFPVLIELDNRARELTPGMSVRIGLQVTSDRTGESLQVPRDAIVRGPDGIARVWVVREDGGGAQARPVPVRLGRSFGTNVEIVDGEVVTGDRVVVRGNETLRAGERVRAVAPTAGD
jgi:membrane fusion protein (multidrug efflux system)